MSLLRPHLRGLAVAGLLAAVASCDSPTKVPTTGAIAPRITLVRLDTAGRASAALPPTSMRARAIGPTAQVIDLVLTGNVWSGQLTNLSVGAYEVIIEGLAGGQVQYYGRVTNVSVARGQTASPAIPFGPAVPAVDPPALTNTTSFSQQVTFEPISGATGYTVEFTQDPTFGAGVTSFVSTVADPLVTVTSPGTWYLRTRAILPNILASSVPWSDVRSWIVLESTGGDDEGDATPVTAPPSTPQSVGNRNLTSTKREDWFEFDVRQGDSLFVETFAQRLTPNASSLNTVLHVFRQDGTTEIGTNDNATGTTDSRVVAIAPATELVLVRVTGSNATTVGHYELHVEIRRLPAAPEDLSAVAVSGTQVNLAWTDLSDNETGFDIERCLGTTCVDFTVVTTVAADVESYNDAALALGNEYRWRVRARNAAGTSEYTDVVNAATTAPATPTTFAATTFSNTRIDLSWVDVANNETAYEVERCTGAACDTFAPLVTLGPGSQTHSDVTAAYNQTYVYRVRAVNLVLPSAYSSTATANTIPPATPTGLTAQVAGPTRIDLAWTDVANNELGYRIERCLGDACSNFAEIGTAAANAESYQDNAVANNAGYRYRIRAYHAVTSQTYSNVVNGDTRPPAAASGLVATTTSGTSIDLAWSDNSDDETGFRIERCSSGPACTDFTEVTTVAADAEAYTDNSAVLGTSYRYQVVAVGIPGEAAPSNIAAANTLLPTAPTALVATTVDGTTIELNWTDNSDNETNWEISRCTGAACPTPTPYDTIPAGTATYTDIAAVPGNSYVYAVRAMNVSGRSAPSNNSGANTLPPTAPTGLTAGTLSGTLVHLEWAHTDPSVTGTRVERCLGTAPCGPFAEIAFVPHPASVYDDATAEEGNVYTYRIRSQNAADVSVYTAEVSASTQLPNAPSGFTAVAVSQAQVDLNWTLSTGPGVVGYVVERCDAPGCTGFVVLDSLNEAATSYQDAAVAAEADYVYQVRAVNVVGRGPATSSIAVDTRTPAVPTGLTATVMTGYVHLTWTDAADNESGFVIERCAGGGCSPVDLTTLPTVGLETFDDVGVVANTEYTYRIRAYNAVANSAPSTTASVNTLIADQVIVLSGSAASTTQVDLNWTPSASQGTGLITAYLVYRCGGNCDPATGSVIATLAADAVAYSDATVEENSAYTYAVVPVTAFAETAVAGSATIFVSTALPGAPSGVVGELLSPTSIQLTWNDNSNELGFEVAQCAGVGCTDFVTVATTASDVATFLADTLTFSVEYRFLVRSVNSAGASASTDTLSIGTTVPAAPTGLAAFITDGAGNVQLVWTDESDDETSFFIDYCAGAGCESWLPFNDTNPDETLFDIGSIGPATYRFRVRALNPAGSSVPSDFTQITGDGPYAPPIGATATTTGPTSIRVTWTDQTDNETIFRIFRCTGGGCEPQAGAEVGVVPRDSTVFDDTGVTTGEVYVYRVVANNGFAEAASTPFDGHTMLPDAASSLSATTLTDMDIQLDWSDGGPFETGYVIERCAGGGCVDFAAIDTVPANFVSYIDAGLTPNQLYRYQVRAINAVGAADPSNIAEKATDIPATPTALSALAMTLTRIDLAWTDNATNEDFYIVERCAGICDAAGSFVEIESGLAPNAQAFSDHTVNAGQTYSYRVRALNAGGVSPTTNIASATAAVPSDPADLTVTTLSGTLIELTWTDNATNETVYEVERCESATCPTFSLVRVLPENTGSYVDTVAVDDEYTYRVRAANNVGASGYTFDASANTIRPAAASDFTVATVSGTRIDLTWTDNATNEDGYVLERCIGPACDTFEVLDSLPPDASGYQNDGIPTETSFTYRLYAYNIAGPSDVAGPSTATTITPAAPSGLSSVLAAPGQIDLSWTDNATNEMQYRVERCAGAGTCSTQELMNLNAVEVATLAADAVGYSDPGLAPNTNYFYRVRATNTAGTSPYSAIVNRSTSVPPAPSGLSSFTVLATRVDLFWSDNAGNEEGFRVERCIGPDPCTVFTEIAVLPVNSETYQDLTITAAPEVYYRVVAFNGGGGNASNVSFASTVVPAAPSDFTADPSGQAAVNLAWVDNASDEVGFAIERCTGLDCVDFVAIDSVAADETSFADLTVTAGNVYRYRIAAYGNGQSDYSTTADAATILPNAVTDLVATAISDTRVDLAWTDNTSTDSLWNETAFAIYRCAGDACTPTVLHATVGRDTAFFADSLLPAGEIFTYHVVALNLAGEAAPSATASAATTVPAVPTALADSTVSSTEVLLTWVDNAGTETGYEIYSCEGAGCSNFALAATAAADAESHVVGGLVAGTVYLFRVRAVNANGTSGGSNIVAAQSDVPPTPSDLVGAAVSPTQVNLTWTDNAENETAYIVERCDGTGCGSFVVLDSLAADVTSYQDLTIAIDTLYQYRVRASNAVGPSGYVTEIAVSTYRPATPTGLAATPFSATRVDLTWNDVAANDTVIVVERCIGFECSDFADLVALAPDATAYSDLTVTVNNTYNYRLRAENAAGASAATDSVEVGTFIPSDPSGLTATTISPTEISLGWVDNSNTEMDFRIDRCEGEACDTFAELAVVAADAVSYQDATAVLGVAYRYQVVARGGGGNSAPSNIADANTYPAGNVATLSAAPLTATTLQLSWSAADFATVYQIATVIGSDTTAFAETSAGITDTVVTVATDQVYQFVVRANNAAAAGEYAGASVAMTPPPAPVNLTAFPLTSSQVALAWTDTSSRETGFEIERAFFSAGSFGAYTTVSTLGADVTAEVDEVAAPMGRYRYRARAVNQVGAGEYSNEVDLTLVTPGAPTGLASSVTAPGQITLTWADNSDSEQSFSIERSVGNNLAFAQIATVGAGTTAHVDSSGLTINTAYYYRVRAVNSIGASGYSNESSTTTTVPNSISITNATIQSSTSIQLTWDGAAAVGELGFRVYRCAGPGCVDYTLLDGSLPPDETTFLDAAAVYGTVYRYQVRPYNIAGEPAANPTVQLALVLPTPFGVIPQPSSRTDILVRWSANSFTWETGFEIEQCAGFSCSNFAPLATVAANDSVYISTGLPANGAWHRYRVRAVADGNVGPWSSAFSTHTPKELTLGDTLVTISGPETVNNNMTHYVVSMPAGSPTVELTVGNDPGGATTNNITYLLAQRDKPIQRPAQFIWSAGSGNPGGVVGDSLCASGIETPFDQPSVTCSLPHPNATTDYFITTYSLEYTNLFVSALPGPTTYTFNTCGQAGRLGPAQGQCDAAYTGTSLESQVVVLDAGFQDWNVPFTGRWAVVAVGAAGASGSGGTGGRGARIYGEFELTAGQDLRLAVGQMGSGAGLGQNGGGGGGSFVYDLTGATPMLIAGGGGGTRRDAGQNGCDASITAFAGLGSGFSSTSPCSLKGSGAGLGGAVSSVSYGSGGAGFNGDGTPDHWANNEMFFAAGRGWANLLLGGEDPIYLGPGGFGGGGSGYGGWGGGGGGGYSGGDGGYIAGGGGSFNAGTNTAAAVGIGTGHGTIILRYLGPSTP